MHREEQRAKEVIDQFDAIITDEGKTQRVRLGEIEALMSQLVTLPLADRSPLAAQVSGKIRSPKLKNQRDAVIAALLAAR